jgi:hypothetical protein
MAMMIRKMNNDEDGAVETAKIIAITLLHGEDDYKN